MTRKKKIILTFTISFLLIGLFGFLFLRSSYFLDEFLKEPIIQVIEEQIDGKYAVYIDRLSGNIFTGVQAKEFRIKERDIDVPPVLNTAEIVLNYDFWGLLKRKLIISGLEINYPEFNIFRNSEGQLNLTQVLRESTKDSDSTFTFNISNVIVKDGQINFIDEKHNTQFNLPDITLKMDEKKTGSGYFGSLVFGKGSFSIDGKELSIDTLGKEMQFNLSTTGGNLQEHHLKFGNSDLILSGEWNNSNKWELNAELSFDAVDIEKFLIDDFQLNGNAEISLEVNGTNTTLNGSLIVEVPKLSIEKRLDLKVPSKTNAKQIDISNVIVDTSLELNEESKITFNELSLQIAEGNVSGSGSLTFDNTSEGNIIERIQHYVKNPISYNTNWDMSDVQLKPLLPIWVQIPPSAPQIKSGVVSGSAKIIGNTYGDYDINGNLHLSNASLLTRTKTIKLQDSSLNCTIIPESADSLTIRVDGKIDGADVDIKGNLETPTVVLSNVDFGKLCEIANTLPLKGIGTITAQIKEDRTATGHIEIPETFFDNDYIPMGRLAGDYRYQNGVVYFENADLTKNGVNGDTRIAIEGQVKLEGKLPVNMRIIAEKLVLDEDYNRILLKNKYPIVGIISGELNLYNSLTHLDGRGEFRVESGVAWEVNLDPLQLQLDIKDTSLTIQDFQITSRGQLVILNTHISKTGDFDFSLKNSKERPIRMSEIAVAASIEDFPFDGLMNVNITSFYKKPDNSSTEVSIHITDLSFNNNPLGDGYVNGKLIEPPEQSTEPGYFKFIGKAFDETTNIEGTVSLGTDNLYDFTAISNKIAATPILRIFNPTLESITGTADSIVRIKGTIAELTSSKPQDSNRRVYPYDVDIVINNTELQYNSLYFSNPNPIRIEIVDDIITFSDSSLAVGDGRIPFLKIAGTIDAKTEIINIVSSQNQDLTLNAFVKELDLPISGLAYYNLKLQGTLSNPIVGVNWQIPSLVWNTDSGDVRISNAIGEFNYVNNLLSIQPFSLNLFNNIVQVEGNITINQDNFDKSQLYLNVNGDDIALADFSDIVKNSLPDEVVNRLSAKDTSFLNGNVNVQLNINGSIAEPIIDIRTHTDDDPIYIGTFEKAISIDDIHAVATVGSELVDIVDLLVKGQIGKSYFHVDGEIAFSRINNKEMKYNLGVSAEKLEIADFLKVINVDSSLLNGQISGNVIISWDGFDYDDISVTSNIHELTLNYNNIQIVNITPIDLAIKGSIITTIIPIKLTSPTLDTQADIGIEGAITTPKIDVNWQGSLINLLHQQSNLPIQWSGKIQYLEKQITIFSELNNNGHSLKLTGLIPFNLNLQKVTTPERFIDLPINVQLVGNELPLTFFPGIDTIFEEVDGVTDINLALNGTTRSPHLEGNVFIEATKIQTKSLNQVLDKVRLQLKAREDLIELVQCKFEIGDGTFDLRKCELQLEGLMPKYLIVEDVSFKKYPLNSVLQKILPQDSFKEVYGEVTTSISKMMISFDSFFQQGEEIPIPRIVRSVNYDAITREAEAEFTVDHITLGFISLDQQFEFTNPETVPFTLNTGTFRLNGIRLENTIPVNPDEVDAPLVLSCFGRLDLQGEIFANLKISNFNISSLRFFLPNEFTKRYKINGILTTTVSITGEYAAPNILIRLGGEKLAINQADIDEFSGELRYDSHSQHWTIIEEKTQIRIGNNRLICSGSVPLNISLIESKVQPSSDPMDVRISLIMDELGILPLIDPHIQSAVGEGNITASITGSVHAAEISGHGDLNIESLSIERSPIYFENLESTFEFTEKGIRFDEMKGQLNSGDFTANGDIITDWFEVQSVDIRGSMKNAIFVENEKYQIELSSDNLHLTGMISDTQLNGDIRIHSGQYKQNWNWGDLLDSFSAGTVTDIDLLFYAPFIRNLTLNLDVDIPNNFHLLSSTGGHTDIEIKCQGQLTGAIQAPIFTGDLSILRGQISIVTQIFEIQEGSTIRNLSDKSFNPELDIILKTPNPIRGVVLRDGSTADLMITATVTGKLENANIDNAKVSLGAEPINSSTTVIFTDADVLALLSPGNSISRSFWGITFTISSGFDPNQRHIIGEYPLPFGNNMSIRMEGDEKGEFGVDLQLLERRF